MELWAVHPLSSRFNRIDFRLFSNLHAWNDSWDPNSGIHNIEEVNQSAGIAGEYPLDLIPSFGLGLSYKIKKMSLMLKTDYRLGLSNFFGEGVNSSGEIIRNRYLNLSLGMKFNKF